MKSRTIADLNKIYSDSNEIDSSIFAEMRSNVLLAIGEHYSKKSSQFWSRTRDLNHLSDEQKLRLTKNHIHRICNIYVNGIFSIAPGVTIIPKNEKEIQDQKVAELHSSVWEDWKARNGYRDGLRQRIESFVKTGEVAVKIFFNPYGGLFKGYEQLTDEVTMMPVMDENGYPAADKSRPIFEGKIELERIFAPNLLRDSNSKSMEDGMLIYRKMVDVKTLEEMYKDDPEKLSFVKASGQDVYTVFEGSTGNYSNSKEQVMVREFYEPPCLEYPKGYFWITTELGVLEEAELPFGVMPILVTGMDDVETSPRRRSIIKQLRPYQAECNRAASAIATAQITLGDDKLIVNQGTTVTQAGKMPGVRVLSTNGGVAPTILAGRSGEQYLEYMQSQIAEMYQVANIEEDLTEKKMATGDPFSELFKAVRHKKKFSLYAEKIVNFEKKICETVIRLGKGYYTDDMIIPIVGRNEIVNIEEYRNATDIGYQIKIEEQSDDYETKMGKFLTMNHTLQYVGNQLSREDIGKILRVGPYTNREESFSDLTTDYDMQTNVILALDRGEYLPIHKYEDHKYGIKRLVNRSKQSDFRFLSPEIQQMYEQRIAEHEQMEALVLQEIKRQQSQFIPASGPLIAVDFYISDPEKPSRTRRARLPYDSVDWLIKQLASQGSEITALSKLNEQSVADIAQKMPTEPLPGGMQAQTGQSDLDILSRLSGGAGGNGGGYPSFQ